MWVDLSIGVADNTDRIFQGNVGAVIAVCTGHSFDPRESP